MTKGQDEGGLEDPTKRLFMAGVAALGAVGIIKSAMPDTALAQALRGTEGKDSKEYIREMVENAVEYRLGDPLLYTITDKKGVKGIAFKLKSADGRSILAWCHLPQNCQTADLPLVIIGGTKEDADKLKLMAAQAKFLPTVLSDPDSSGKVWAPVKIRFGPRDLFFFRLSPEQALFARFPDDYAQSSLREKK